MQIFNSGMFWFVEGVLFCVMLLGMRNWAQERSIPMQWWKWLVFLCWVLLAGFTVTFVGTSLGENEASAATRGGLFFGLLTVLSGVGVWRLVLMGSRQREQRTTES